MLADSMMPEACTWRGCVGDDATLAEDGDDLVGRLLGGA